MSEIARTLGVLGGTFDPVHVGHLELARGVASALGLDRVLLVLSARPPHKPDREVTSSEHRLAMLRLAVAGEPLLEASALEVERGGASFTIDTLRELEAGPPRCLPVFILGLDALFDLPTWREWRAIAAEFDLVAVDRPGRDLERDRCRLDPFLASRLVRTLDPPTGRGGRILHLALPEIPVSSREVRARAGQGRSLAGLVPPSVARYIRDHRLYSQGGTLP